MNERLFLLAKKIPVAFAEHSKKSINYLLVYNFINLVRNFFNLKSDISYVSPKEKGISNFIDKISLQAGIHFAEFKEHRNKFFPCFLPMIGIDENGRLAVFLPFGFKKYCAYFTGEKNYKIINLKSLQEDFFLLGMFYPNYKSYSSFNDFIKSIFPIKKIVTSLFFINLIIAFIICFFVFLFSDVLIISFFPKIFFLLFAVFLLFISLLLVVSHLVPGTNIFSFSLLNYLYYMSLNNKNIDSNIVLDLQMKIKKVTKNISDNFLVFSSLIFFVSLGLGIGIFYSLFFLAAYIILLLIFIGLFLLFNNKFVKLISRTASSNEIFQDEFYKRLSVFNSIISLKKYDDFSLKIKHFFYPYANNELKVIKLIFIKDAFNFLLPFILSSILVVFLTSSRHPIMYWQITFILFSIVIGIFFIKRVKLGTKDLFLSMYKKISFPHFSQALKVKPIEIKGKIELVEASFSFDDQSLVLFKDVSLCINVGEIVAITGPSGSGKSTLISILSSFSLPTLGMALFDGQDARSLNLFELRKNFGAVFQQSKLFPGTIWQNINAGRDISPQKIADWLSLKPVFYSLFDLSMGLDTYVFWHERNISHFDKSLVLLARALIDDPKIIFLDEPLINLNTAHQKLFFDFLQSLDITRIISTHSAVDQKNFDQIFLLQNSEVIKLK